MCKPIFCSSLQKSVVCYFVVEKFEESVKVKLSFNEGGEVKCYIQMKEIPFGIGYLVGLMMKKTKKMRTRAGKMSNHCSL